MKTRPITVVETGTFLRQSEKIWNEDDLSVLVDHVARNPESGDIVPGGRATRGPEPVARNPESGDIVPGTGGVRKMRWARAGGGKRGGARVIYFYYDLDHPLYLLLAYAKAQASDMSADEKKAVGALAATIKGAGHKEQKR